MIGKRRHRRTKERVETAQKDEGEGRDGTEGRRRGWRRHRRTKERVETAQKDEGEGRDGTEERRRG